MNPNLIDIEKEKNQQFQQPFQQLYSQQSSQPYQPIKRKRSIKMHQRDINRPKRPLTPYFCFLKEQRDNFVGKGYECKEIGKVYGKIWRDMPESEKSKYNYMAEQERFRFKNEMESYYNNPEGFRRTQNNQQSNFNNNNNQRMTTIINNNNNYNHGNTSNSGNNGNIQSNNHTMPNTQNIRTPKNPLSSYFFFLAEVREMIQAQGFEGKDVSIEASKLWRLLDYSKKSKYIELCKKDQERFQREKKELLENSNNGTFNKIRNGYGNNLDYNQSTESNEYSNSFSLGQGQQVTPSETENCIDNYNTSNTYIENNKNCNQNNSSNNLYEDFLLKQLEEKNEIIKQLKLRIVELEYRKEDKDDQEDNPCDNEDK